MNNNTLRARWTLNIHSKLLNSNIYVHIYIVSTNWSARARCSVPSTNDWVRAIMFIYQCEMRIANGDASRWSVRFTLIYQEYNNNKNKRCSWTANTGTGPRKILSMLLFCSLVRSSVARVFASVICNHDIRTGVLCTRSRIFGLGTLAAPHRTHHMLDEWPLHVNMRIIQSVAFAVSSN